MGSIRISGGRFFILSETHNTGRHGGEPNEKTEKIHVSALFATEGGWQQFTLKGGEWLILGLSGASAVLALLVGWYLSLVVLLQVSPVISV